MWKHFDIALELQFRGKLVLIRWGGSQQCYFGYT
jgi:hypothetical protein